MSTVKSFSVGNGDMFYISHNSDNLTTIDCCLTDDVKDDILDEIESESSDKGIKRFFSIAALYMRDSRVYVFPGCRFLEHSPSGIETHILVVSRVMAVDGFDASHSGCLSAMLLAILVYFRSPAGAPGFRFSAIPYAFI